MPRHVYTCAFALVHAALMGAPRLEAQAPPEPPAAPGDLASPPAEAETSPSGLATRILKPGRDSRHPQASDYVTFHYTGWTADGKVFDSTLTKPHPPNLPLARVMKGLGEGLQLMAEGETRRMWIPETLAFAGATGKPKGNLVLDVELLGFDPPPTQAPPDVALPSADVLVTPSGLRYRRLRPGSGTQHPSRRSHVYVHYTGWTTDGKMFDSSVLKGSPTGLRLDQVIKGWAEGIPLMVKGEKVRFWIPEKLAYRGESGKPGGILVFDVELLDFWK